MMIPLLAAFRLPWAVGWHSSMLLPKGPREICSQGPLFIKDSYFRIRVGFLITNRKYFD